MIPNQTSLPRLFKGIALFTPGGDLIYGIDTNKQARWHIHLCIGLQHILGLSEPPHFLVPGYTATVDRWLDPKLQKLRTSAEIYPAVKRYQPLLSVLFETQELIWQTIAWQEEYCNPFILETYRHQFPQLWEDHNLIVRFDPSYDRQQSNLSKIKATDYLDRFLTRQEPQDLPTDDSTYSQSIANSTESQEEEENISNPSIYTRDIQTNQTENPFLEEAQDFSHNKPLATPANLASLSSVMKNNSGYVLRLFISGDNTAMEKTLIKIHQLLEEGLTYPYTLKVIDISKNPEQAENHHISATPTLVRVWPKPIRRIVGKLDDFEKVLQIISSY